METTRDPAGPMGQTIAVLRGQGLPWTDAEELPASTGRFADGRAWRLEIPSVEGPAAMAAVIEEAAARGVRVDRVSQGSGISMLTGAELGEMLALGEEHRIEVCLFVGPRAGWGVGRQPVSSAGAVAGPTLRGADQVRFALEEVRHAVGCGLRSILVGDIGLLAVIGRAKASGDLPAELVVKTSVALPCTNPATAVVLADLGATSINLGTDLTLGQIAAIRQAIGTPVDVYCEAPDDFGGVIRHFEVIDMVRVAAPIYLKYTVRNAPGIYPSGAHLAGTVLATARERVRRAALAIELLDRYRGADAGDRAGGGS